MKTIHRFWARERLRFGYALYGIRQFFISEYHARIHLAATLLVVVAALVYKISRAEALLLTLVITLVWIAEILNTCIEKTLDRLAPEIHPQTRFIKDAAAGAVLLAALCSIITGLFIFLPKL
jgi:diacylglycerol kinase